MLGSPVALAGCGGDKPKPGVVEAQSKSEAACADGKENDQDGTLGCDDRDCQSPGGGCKAAPDLDRTVATTLSKAAAYLYGGDNPLQKDADANAFDRRRVAMLRGCAVDADGAPQATVKVSVKGHPDCGYTYSRGGGSSTWPSTRVRVWC